MKQLSFLNVSFAFSALLAISACGATDDSNQGINPDAGGGVIECVKTAEVEGSCGNGLDDDCNGKIDCEDIECAFDAICTGGGGGGGGGDDCEELSFGGEPLAIPDVLQVDYESSLDIAGFDNGQLLETTEGFTTVCVVMEHSWLRDLQIELSCPSGETLVLHEFGGRTPFHELYMGVPNDSDGVDPTPGQGAEYCWNVMGNTTMMSWANSNMTSQTLPTGDYSPYDNLDELLGCTLNGEWTMRVVDDWAGDNGYIFDWSIEFSADIIPDCLIVVE